MSIERDVFYLIRGRKGTTQKIVLVHGSFFETLQKAELIKQSFSQILTEKLPEKEQLLTENTKNILVSLLSEQENFSKVRNVENASVKLRFRVMTEVKTEANLLNTKKYPAIADNTINFVVPYYTEQEYLLTQEKMATVFSSQELEIFNVFKLKHYLNGYFLVFQTKI